MGWEDDRFCLVRPSSLISHVGSFSIIYSTETFLLDFGLLPNKMELTELFFCNHSNEELIVGFQQQRVFWCYSE